MMQGLRRRIVDALQRSLFDEPVPPRATVFEPAAPTAPTQAPTSPRVAPPEAPRGRGASGVRSARLGAEAIDYVLRRSRRRSIGFVVGPAGLVVSAPKWVGLRDIDAAVQEKGRWIAAKLAEQRELQSRREAARTVWRDGARIDYLGAPLVIRLDARTADVALDASTTPPTLHVGLPLDADEARIRDLVQSWLQREARRVFAERAAVFAPRLGVTVTRLSLSSAETRWGSASASGAIRLNWRLVHHAVATIDYVVAHELAHLREMNHGPRFWATVRSVLPDYEAERQRLREAARVGG